MPLDEQLRRVHDGDGESLRVVMNENAPLAYGIALRITGSEADAADIVQEVFIGLPEALAKFDGHNTANHLGACCVECTASQSIPSSPRPFCDGGSGGGGGGSCSGEPGAGEFGANFCNPTTDGNPNSPHYDPWCAPGGMYGTGTLCPAAYVCCYGGNYGDGPY